MNTHIARAFVFVAIIVGATTVSAQSAVTGTSRVDTQTVTDRIILGASTVFETKALVGKPFVLDGTRSTDDGTVRTFSWKQVSGPSTLKIQEGAILSITPPVAGTYAFDLVATDDSGLAKKEATATIRVHGEVTVTKQSSTSNSPATTSSPQAQQKSKDPEIKRDPVIQYNESDMEFIRLTAKPSATILVNAAVVRGWDPEKKKEIIGKAKVSTKVKSEQDLEHFAQVTLLNDENVEDITIDEQGVHVTYRMPAKFLGIFSSSLYLNTDVDAEGRVKVKFPWMRFMFSTSVDSAATEQAINAKIDGVKAELQGKIDTQASVRAQATLQITAEIIQLVTSLNKATHETAKSIIQNIRA